MSLLAPFQFIQQRGGKAAKRELVDTGRTARTRGQLDLTAWRESAKPPCVKAARRSQKLEREKKKVLCVGIHPLLLLCHTARMCIHRLLNALAVAPVPPRSLRSMETRRAPGSRARPLRGASWRIHPPEYRCLLALRAAFFHLLSLILFLDYFQKKKKKTWRWIFGSRGENLVSDCLQLLPSISSSAADTKQIDLFLPTFKNLSAVY